MKIITKSHHRNGVSGCPFDVYVFKDDDKTVKVALDFGGDAFGVLQIDKLVENDVAFGSNSWRGDHYSSKIRELAEQVKDDVADGAFFVKYSTKNA